MQPETEPRRLVNADVIRMMHEQTMAQATRSAEPYVTVEFTRNAKGETQISTKVSAPGGVDSDALYALAAEARAVAEDTYAAAANSFPYNGSA